MVKSSQINMKGNKYMRKTKIVCTLGPATDNEEVLRNLMLEGMNVARINFSHGNYQDQEDRINMLKKVRDELKLPVPLLLDTQGPEIRIGKFENNEIYLDNGQEFTLINNDELGNKEKKLSAFIDPYKALKNSNEYFNDWRYYR